MKAIKTIYLGLTNFRGSRIKATDCDRNHVVINWSHELSAEDNHKQAAKALAEKMQWKGKLVMGSLNDCYVHVFTE